VTVLAIGAHPDDIEIGCGGLLIKLCRKNRRVYEYILTHGEAAGNSSKERSEEANESAKMMGIKKVWYGNFKDTELMPNGILVNSIEKIINRVRPNLILTHSIRDEHHDHRAVGLATIEAARYFPNILAYENPLTKDFTPQVFVDISDVIEEKMKSLLMYHSQRKKKYLRKKAIFGLAQYRALQSRLDNVNFAEAFQIVKYARADHILGV